MKPDFLINEDDLKEWLGYERRSDIENWLLSHRINWRCGKGGKVVTMRSAVEQAFDATPAAKAASF
jgi:hypothetical protein